MTAPNNSESMTNSPAGNADSFPEQKRCATMTATNNATNTPQAANAVGIGSTDLICEACGANGATKYRQNTQYYDDARNWATLCLPCREDNDAYWRERWDEYYANRI